jgi:tetratricopeptide (TPR) repeat protein
MTRLLRVTAFILLFSFPLVAEERPFEWDDVERIVAIGDIHGAYDNMVRVLQNADLIDDKLRWVGGETHLVQNGDMLDRGPDSRKAMDLLMKLEDKAEDAGGRVHVLIGNHEAMNIIGVLDLVSAEEYEAFVDRDSRKRRDQIFGRYYEQLRREARKSGEDAPKERVAREQFDHDYPLGYVEHRRAFSTDGKYGKWIQAHNTAVKINGIVFTHGDWSEKFSAMGLAEVNLRIRQELTGESPIKEGIAFDTASPLQYRGLAQTELTTIAQESAQPLVARILQNLDAKRMVVGHTVTEGVIESRFDGKHISIDLGMLELYRGGHRVALEIVDDELRAIHDGGTIPVPESLNEANLGAYLDAVAEVDPTNVDVQLKRVDAMRDEGRFAEAVPILESLVESKPTHIPFRYRELLGTYYRGQGDTASADAQFRAYIDGLSAMVSSDPSNLNLANLLARFCVEKGLEIDLAEEVIANAIEQAPDNYNFRLTLARVRIAQDEFSNVFEVLGKVGESEEAFAYDTHYLYGLAYAGLEQRDEARIAFQRAIDVEPDRLEAREALDRLGASRN